MSCEACDSLGDYCGDCEELMREEHERCGEIPWSEYKEESVDAHGVGRL